MNGPRAKQRGVAVLMAMLVVTVGTILAVDMMWQLALDQRRTASALAADQGLLLAESAEDWAGDILHEDSVKSPDTDNLSEPWAVQLPPLPFDGGVISGHLEDLQGRFNLNNLVTADGKQDKLMVAQFQRLLALVGLDPALASAVVDWLDPDGKTRFPDGAEDAVYADKDPQYRAADTMITTPTELMAVQGFDRKSYARIAPYVTALPRGTKLNVNTATAVLLASLSDKIDLPMAQTLVDERGGAAFPDIQAAFSGLIDAKMFDRIDGVSSHFLLTAEITLGTSHLTVKSVLQRGAGGLTRPLFRSFGVQ